MLRDKIHDKRQRESHFELQFVGRWFIVMRPDVRRVEWTESFSLFQEWILEFSFILAPSRVFFSKLLVHNILMNSARVVGCCRCSGRESAATECQGRPSISGQSDWSSACQLAHVQGLL
jgi:hypothetical protein